MNYLNTDTPLILFEEARNNDIYVDKSLLIEEVSKHIRTGNKYICVTRPRRFGKTINANMLGAYYLKGFDSNFVFQNLKIAEQKDYALHLNQHNVMYIDFSRMPDECQNYETYIGSIRRKMKEDLEEKYSFLKEKEYDSLSDLLRNSGDSFIFIMDEWDAVFYKDFMTESDRIQFLGFLKNILKDQPYVELAYLTGVLPIAKYSSGSELNMFDEYYFMNDNIYDIFFGFTESEVQKLCQMQKKISYEELQYWYDGYFLSDGKRLFNPRSVNKALLRGVCLNYWTETGPMNEIADCIEHNVDEVREDLVKMIAGIPVEVDLLGYSAAELQLDTRDEILSAMTVYGFLSYHDGMLSIPNHELMEKFQQVLSRDSMGEVKDIVASSKEILQATLMKDEKKVANMLEEVHDREIPFLQYGDENSLSCVITLCYLYARKDYIVEREAKSGKGYCDYLFIPKKNRKTAIILELKVNDSCENAIKQIKNRNYMKKVENCSEIILVGINYDKTKKHECKIEVINSGKE